MAEAGPGPWVLDSLRKPHGVWLCLRLPSQCLPIAGRWQAGCGPVASSAIPVDTSTACCAKGRREVFKRTSQFARASRGGNEGYAAAVRVCIAEDQNHARLLAALLVAANAPAITSHRSDAGFVRLRRALGVRLELMVLFVAGFIALGYCRALRDGVGEPLAAEAAGRILAD